MVPLHHTVRVNRVLAEAGLLAVIGGAAGILVARFTLLGIRSMLPAQAAATIQPGLDLRVMLFAGVLAVGTGLAFDLTVDDVKRAVKGFRDRSAARAARREAARQAQRARAASEPPKATPRAMMKVKSMTHLRRHRMIRKVLVSIV